MENKQCLLITGISGLLGSNLAYYFKDIYQVNGIYLSHPVKVAGVQSRKVDITVKEELQRAIDEIDPDVLIHCAALANIDICEENPDLAERVNVYGVKNIVESIKRRDTKLIHISTDAIFDGEQGNYTEVNEVNPPHVYGRTKCQGEREASKREGSLIARVNIFGWDAQTNRSLGEWVVNELSAGRNIKGFTDVYFSSMYTLKLAELLYLAIQKYLGGIYNFASSTALSKYEFAVNIAKAFGLDTSLIEPISVDNFSFKAARAKNLMLDTAKLQNALRREIPTIEDSIEAFYDDFKGGIPGKIQGQSPLTKAL